MNKEFHRIKSKNKEEVVVADNENEAKHKFLAVYEKEIVTSCVHEGSADGAMYRTMPTTGFVYEGPLGF